MSRYIIHNILIFIAVSILSCAQPATPTGGEKDTQAPKITETSIPTNQSLAKPNKITFYFDENIQVKNATGDITISPFISKNTTIKSSNKKIEITIDSDSLKANTTYSICLNQSVSDLNENNIGSYAPLLFSTGLKIDSQYINISISTLQKPKKNNHIIQANNFLYPDIKYGTTTKNNKATLYGLKQSPHQVIVFNDENGNNLLDSTESLGYHIIDSLSTDTTQVFLYSQKKTPISTFKINNNYYATGIEPFAVDFSAYPKISLIKDTLFSDSTTIYNLIKNLPQNHYIIPNNFETKKPYISYQIDDSDTNHTSIRIAFNSYVASALKDSIIILEKNGDTLGTNNYTCEIDKNTLRIKTTAPIQKIILLPQTITTNLVKNTETIAIQPSKYCSLVFQNTNSSALIGRVFGNTTHIDLKIEGKSSVSILVPCGTYKAYFFSDHDNNHYITPPNVAKQLPGEPIIIIDRIETTNNNKISNEIILKHRE